MMTMVRKQYRWRRGSRNVVAGFGVSGEGRCRRLEGGLENGLSVDSFRPSTRRPGQAVGSVVVLLLEEG